MHQGSARCEGRRYSQLEDQQLKRSDSYQGSCVWIARSFICNCLIILGESPRANCRCCASITKEYEAKAISVEILSAR